MAVVVWQGQFLFQQARALILGNSELAAEKYGWMLADSVDTVEISPVLTGQTGTHLVTLRRGSTTETIGCGTTQHLAGEEAKHFMQLWSAMHFHRGYAMVDHQPAFAVRFLWKGKSILETTVSAFGCSFPAPSEFGDPFGLLGEHLIGFNRTIPPGLAFIAELQRRFPDSAEWIKIEERRKLKTAPSASTSGPTASESPPKK